MAVSISPQEKDLLARLALAEAGSEGVVGMALVVRSVLNRVEVTKNGSRVFGTSTGTVSAIVNAPTQYTPVTNGTINYTRSQSEIDNANRAINLALNPPTLQKEIQKDGYTAQQSRSLVLSTGFDALGGQGRQTTGVYRGHTFVQNINNYGVTGDSIYRSSLSPTSSETSRGGGKGTTIGNTTVLQQETNNPVEPVLSVDFYQKGPNGEDLYLVTLTTGEQYTTDNPAPRIEAMESRTIYGYNADIPPQVVASDFDNLSTDKLEEYSKSIKEELDFFNTQNKDPRNLTEEQRGQLTALLETRQALLQQAEKRGLLKDKPQCVKKESDNSITFADTPECEQFLKSVLGNNLAALGGEEYATANPCGTTDMDKINVELLKFFKKLKGIKKYANLYINGSLNKITSVTNLVRSTGSIIAAVLKGLVQRFRNYVLYKIKRGIIDVIDTLFPNNVVNIKRNLFQKIIDSILCKFKDIMNGLKDLVVDFLFELIGKIANAPFCVAEQFTNALVNNLASSIDGAIAPVLDQISDVLGGATKFAGQIFEALDFILGFESFLCARPACPEVNKITSGPWGGPSPSNPNAFERFLASPDLDAGEATRFINDTLNNTLGLGFLDKGVNGESIQAAPGSVTDCSTAPFKCGPPTVEFFGGGGAGAVGAAVVDTAGKILGVDLIFGGSSYTRPPFVTFMDSCGRGSYASGYTKIDNDGRVTEVIMVNNGSGYLNAFDGTTEFDDDPERNTIPFPTEEEVTDYVVCLKEIEVISTGIGYQPTDEITITPDIPNLKARVKMTEAGQIIAIDILEQSCNLTTVPEITINSLMGGGLEVRPILTFTRIEDFDPLLSSEGSTPQNIVRVIDCVS